MPEVEHWSHKGRQQPGGELASARASAVSKLICHSLDPAARAAMERRIKPATFRSIVVEAACMESKARRSAGKRSPRAGRPKLSALRFARRSREDRAGPRRNVRKSRPWLLGSMKKLGGVVHLKGLGWELGASPSSAQPPEADDGPHLAGRYRPEGRKFDPRAACQNRRTRL